MDELEKLLDRQSESAKELLVGQEQVNRQSGVNLDEYTFLGFAFFRLKHPITNSPQASILWEFFFCRQAEAPNAQAKFVRPSCIGV